MKDINIFAIETSCDETSCAVVRNGNEVLSNVVSSQIDTHVKTGGVIPEVASRLHAEQITYVINQAIEESKLTFDDIDAIAITAGPGLVGALLVGIEAAKTLAFCYDKPLIGVHHIAGHIYANRIEKQLNFPLMALVVSGGHTELIYMKSDLDFEIVCRTTDDAIGETFDKVARILRLPYPGGPHIERLAKLSEELVDLNYKYDSNNSNFSYSGLKTAVINYVNTNKMRNIDINEEAVCNTFQQLAVEQIVDKTLNAIRTYDVNQLVVAGGVAANSFLRERLETEVDISVIVPSIKFCTDNAVMIAAAAYPQFLKSDFTDFSLNADPNLSLKEFYNEK